MVCLPLPLPLPRAEQLCISRCNNNIVVSGFGCQSNNYYSNLNFVSSPCSSSSSSSYSNNNNNVLLLMSVRRNSHCNYYHNNRSIRKRKSVLVCCKYNNSYSNSNSQPDDVDDHDDDSIQATLLLSETRKHYEMLKHGYQQQVNKFSGRSLPFSAQVKEFKADFNSSSVGLGILQRFRNPTMFLKISCQGDFLLPIAVGEFAVQKLIDSSDEDGRGVFSNPFEFLGDMVVELGYEVKMVKITKRVLNTFFARVYFGKEGERVSFSVDARPSDAINVAQRCKAPIYVNKQIVLTDALTISYGTGRVRDTKSVYDVLQDSPLEGPDKFVEELCLVLNLRLAVKEERYNDAAMWRDKLLKLTKSEL